MSLVEDAWKERAHKDAKVCYRIVKCQGEHNFKCNISISVRVYGESYDVHRTAPHIRRPASAVAKCTSRLCAPLSQ